MLIVTASIVFCSAATAQTGPALVIAPWQPEATGEARGSAVWFDDGESENGFDVDLMIYESVGRVRLPEEAGLKLSFGYDLEYIDIGGNDPRLPDRLTDQSIGVGLRVGQLERWTIDVTVGVGFASDSPYDDGDGWYGKASVVGTHAIDDRTTLQLALDYDGNRAVWPDVPLPSVLYTRRENDQFTWALGFPYSQAVWRPTERWLITARYFLPVDGEAKAEYFFLEQLSVYGSLGTHTGRYHVQDTRDTDHLMFRQRRLEAGVNWTPCEYFDVTLAGGWAFDQEFSRGWHAINDSGEFELDDEPFIRVGVTGRF